MPDEGGNVDLLIGLSCHTMISDSEPQKVFSD